MDDTSRSPCGERGLKCYFLVDFYGLDGRSPCGERGLKFATNLSHLQFEPSLPVRGAWIEIQVHRRLPAHQLSLPVRGAWIEIRKKTLHTKTSCSRSPCGERGLKCFGFYNTVRRNCRSPCGERGLKSLLADAGFPPCASLPVRGAWIEIPSGSVISSVGMVAPRAGSVD